MAILTRSIMDYYDANAKTYVIPEELLSEGMKRQLGNHIGDHYLKQYRESLRLATTMDGINSYTKNKWRLDPTAKVPLDDVIKIIMEHVNIFSGNNAKFLENVKNQGWISLKQFRVLRSMSGCCGERNASWETDNDEELYDPMIYRNG